MFVSHYGEYMTTVTETLPEEHGEVSRRHSRSIDRTEGLNMKHGVVALSIDDDRRSRPLC